MTFIIDKYYKMTKMIVEQYRLNFVDYTDSTPNVPRVISNGTLNKTVYYPLGNIYYNVFNKEIIKLPYLNVSEKKEVDEEWFLTRLKDQQIEYAIKFLQIDALKKYIVKNYKSTLFGNPFIHLFYTKYPIDKNIEVTKEIIKVLIENYDDYDKLINEIGRVKDEQLYIMDMIYEMMPVDEENMCSICFQTEPKNMLIKCCKCTTPNHARCLIKWIEQKDKCMTCLTTYKINSPVYVTRSGIVILPEKENVFFPYHDIYYTPLINNHLEKYSGMKRLEMAIMYLQVNRVKELLLEEDILNNLSSFYFGYEPYKQTPIHVLCTGNLHSNAHIKFESNWISYYSIMICLLNTNKFDLKQKDGFDKTPLDYVKSNKVRIIENLLIEYMNTHVDEIVENVV